MTPHDWSAHKPGKGSGNPCTQLYGRIHPELHCAQLAYVHVAAAVRRWPGGWMLVLVLVLPCRPGGAQPVGIPVVLPPTASPSGQPTAAPTLPTTPVPTVVSPL
jgi:hypothetical protein